MCTYSAQYLLPVSLRKLRVELHLQEPKLRRLVGLASAHENIEEQILLEYRQRLAEEDGGWRRQPLSSKPHPAVQNTTSPKFSNTSDHSTVCTGIGGIVDLTTSQLLPPQYSVNTKQHSTDDEGYASDDESVVVIHDEILEDKDCYGSLAGLTRQTSHSNLVSLDDTMTPLTETSRPMASVTVMTTELEDDSD